MVIGLVGPLLPWHQNEKDPVSGDQGRGVYRIDSTMGLSTGSSDQTRGFTPSTKTYPSFHPNKIKRRIKKVVPDTNNVIRRPASKMLTREWLILFKEVGNDSPFVWDHPSFYKQCRIVRLCVRLLLMSSE